MLHTAPDPLFEVEHLGLRAEPEPQQKVRREHRDMVAGCTIDLDEIAPPKIIDLRQAKGLHSGLCSWNVLDALADLVNGYPDATQPRGVRISFANH